MYVKSVRVWNSTLWSYNRGQKCWENCWKQDYFSQIGCSFKIPSPLLPHSMLNETFQPWATLGNLSNRDGELGNGNRKSKLLPLGVSRLRGPPSLARRRGHFIHFGVVRKTWVYSSCFYIALLLCLLLAESNIKLELPVCNLNRFICSLSLIIHTFSLHRFEQVTALLQPIWRNQNNSKFMLVISCFLRKG